MAQPIKSAIYRAAFKEFFLIFGGVSCIHYLWPQRVGEKVKRGHCLVWWQTEDGAIATKQKDYTD